jgi:cytochrome P450
MLQARDESHTRQRKIFTPAFSDRALRQQEPLFLKYTDLLISKLKEGLQEDPKKEFDMVQMFSFTTFDVMGDLTFGEPLHMLDKNSWDPWVSIVFDGIKMGSKMSIIMNYPLIWKPFKAWKKPGASNAKRREHFKHSADRVSKRLEKGRDAEGVDLWDFVLNQKEGRGLSRDEMDSNASLFMMAGTETLATLVSGLTYYLLKSPDKLEKLVDEIRSAFATAEDMTMAGIAALPYLNACLKEALRMYPPVPLGLPRMTPEDGSTICGQFVPPGTTVAIPHYAMYTLEKNFKKPLDFIPERWLGDAEFEDDERNAVQPFSVGSRDCLGKK